MTEKTENCKCSKLDELYALVDKKIYIKLATVFELIEKYDSLDELENFLGFDMSYIINTYLE